MHDKIVSVLRDLERQQDFKILFAAESGSRAWGFASPDSDYDIRVIYAKPESWYWSLDARQPDTFEAMLPDEMDVSAWELHKTLRLFADCNPALNEWLGSPIVYYADPRFAEELRNLIPAYFNPIRAAHHYLSMSAKSLADRQEDGSIAIKKLFYALRGLLAAMWTGKKQAMPPTPFAELLIPDYIAPAISAEITRLQELKAHSIEKARIPFPQVLSDFFVTERANVLRAVETMKNHLYPLDALNQLFYRTIKG